MKCQAKLNKLKQNMNQMMKMIVNQMQKYMKIMIMINQQIYKVK